MVPWEEVAVESKVQDVDNQKANAAITDQNAQEVAVEKYFQDVSTDPKIHN